MKNGGEVRGTLIERSADWMIKIRALDGSVRTIADADVEYAGREGTGALRVAADGAARVSIDRQEVGRTTLAVDNIAPGPHRLHLDFDDSGSSDYTVVVHTGRITSVRAPLPKRQLAARYREGVHFVLGGGPIVGVSGEDGLLGISLNAGINLGISAAIDFRLLGHIGFASILSNAAGPWYEVGTSAAFRFNLSSVYSMEAGARLSIVSITDGSDSRTPAVAPGIQLSLLSLRLGPDRSYELTLWHALQFRESGVLQNGISFSHVWN